MSEDPYHTEFVSWRIDHFWFFSPTNGGWGGWGGHELSGKFNFFNPFLKGMYAPCIAKEVAAGLYSQTLSREGNLYNFQASKKARVQATFSM